MSYMEKPATIGTLFAAFVLISTTDQSVQAQEKLRWKFKTGETLKYTVVQSTNLSMLSMGRNSDTRIALTMHVDWKVDAVGRDGVAQLSQTITRITFVTTGGAFEKMEYDSAKTKADSENPILAAMAKRYGALIDRGITLKMSPRGEISGVKLPKTIVDALGTAPRRGEFAGMLNKDSLKEMISRSGLRLPATTAKDKTWTEEISVNEDFGVKKVNTTYKSLGTKRRKGVLVARIQATPTIAITPKKGAPYVIKLIKQTGSGMIDFAIESGRISNSSIKQKTTMEITIDGQTHEYTSDETFAMTLEAKK